MDKISVVVPCYNEEEAIPIFYKALRKEWKKIPCQMELIFVNDGSNDKSLEKMRELSQKEKGVRYLSFSRNFGKEAALLAGLEYASGDYIAVMDVDLQDPPSYLPVMYQSIKEEGIDCVGLKTRTHDGYSFFRRIFTNFYYKLIEKMSSTQMVPGARDFRLMTKQMKDAVLSMKEYNRYSKGLFSFVGFDTKWIDYDAPERKMGSSKWSFWKLFRYAIEAIVAFSTTPLVLSSFIGILFCFVAFLMILFIIIKTLLWGDPVGGWPSLACIIIFVSGVQLFFFGVIGEYLSKTYLETKKRPIYIIKETEKDIK